jgi:hypothetical protein
MLRRPRRDAARNAGQPFTDLPAMTPFGTSNEP